MNICSHPRAIHVRRLGESLSAGMYHDSGQQSKSLATDSGLDIFAGARTDRRSDAKREAKIYYALVNNTGGVISRSCTC